MKSNTQIDRAKQLVLDLHADVLSGDTWTRDKLEYKISQALAEERNAALEEAILAVHTCQPYQPELESSMLNEAAERIKGLKK